ncbi:unnamed protein product [Tilletia controversa]|uniref:Uncharacterized protein n=3 Tax=Tilletia TaxID=13289 RepID=A0A8X7SUP5_9BASI|nr:hypothetical protein CF336_g7862 [Tilletia laevis]KAE8185976.1 hypothetical protein CF328_g7381 [Tilletia controversa]KAE8246441.1 hypothetical protein A4X03_0g7260 [Tilletia caries]KAE8186934.1 hypothetical protein CF335_g7307 [Tilletia laevis]KAE8242822.1 hypothetical protein A4X06_0g6744 [Tilletia controversa]
MIDSQLKVVSKAWQTVNQHLPEHVDLGPDTRKTAWSKTESPIQARLICSADKQQGVFEVQLRVELAEMTSHKRLKMRVHVEKTDAWLATHKVGDGLFAPTPEVKALPEDLVEPFQIPVLVDLTAARHVQVSVSAETEAAYWADIARFSFHLEPTRTEPISSGNPFPSPTNAMRTTRPSRAASLDRAEQGSC